MRVSLAWYFYFGNTSSAAGGEVLRGNVTAPLATIRGALVDAPDGVVIVRRKARRVSARVIVPVRVAACRIACATGEVTFTAAVTKAAAVGLGRAHARGAGSVSAHARAAGSAPVRLHESATVSKMVGTLHADVHTDGHCRQQAPAPELGIITKIGAVDECWRQRVHDADERWLLALV